MLLPLTVLFTSDNGEAYLFACIQRPSYKNVRAVQQYSLRVASIGSFATQVCTCIT